jgi:hypothetical protein
VTNAVVHDGLDETVAVAVDVDAVVVVVAAISACCTHKKKRQMEVEVGNLAKPNRDRRRDWSPYWDDPVNVRVWGIDLCHSMRMKGGGGDDIDDASVGYVMVVI